MQQTNTPKMTQNESILHDFLTPLEGDPEWPEIPRFFLMRCGEALEEDDLNRCAAPGQRVTCPECLDDNPKPFQEEICTTSSSNPW